MSKKIFRETFEEIAQNVEKKAKGFSKKDFNTLMEAYINDPDFVVEDAKVMGNDYVITRKNPVKEYRKMLGHMLKDLGVEQSEVDNFVENYEFKKVEPLYDFFNNFLYYYLKTGRMYKIFEKEDIVASIGLKKRLKKSKENTKGEIVEQDEYFSLAQKSPCPKWKKTVKDKDGNVCRKLSRLLDE